MFYSPQLAFANVICGVQRGLAQFQIINAYDSPGPKLPFKPKWLLPCDSPLADVRPPRSDGTIQGLSDYCSGTYWGQQ